MIRIILYELNLIEVRKAEQEEFQAIKHNPIYDFWWNNGKPYLDSLIKFYDCLDFECVSRKIKTNKILMYKKILNIEKDINISFRKPDMPKRITTGYRIILLSINEKHYKKHFTHTLAKHKKEINDLINSKERFRYAKLLGLEKS